MPHRSTKIANNLISPKGDSAQEKVRRTAYLFLYFEDAGYVDLSIFLQGVAKLSSVKQILAISILKEQIYPVTTEELHILHELTSNAWVPISEIADRLNTNSDSVRDLAKKGLLLSDADDLDLRQLRKKDEQLAACQWNIHAALYHFMTKWKALRLEIELPTELHELQEYATARGETFQKFIDLYGPPPGHFHAIANPARIQDLPVVGREGSLYETLLNRKTTRAFDKKLSLKLEDLSTVLYYVWGCHGYARVWKDIIGLKKTSPSGGDLHPAEVYPLVRDVEGLEPGLYHYGVKEHRLELLTAMSADEAAELANEFTAGQSYPRSAHVTFIMTARFYRNFWKYRQHQKSYSVILMDAAHLSQTLYLVCTEMGLGAFVTAAINNVNIEQKLGVDGVNEGAIAVCGCGVPLEEFSLDPGFLPYVPRETKL